MRRFVTLFVLFLFAIPFGVSISGCSKSVAPQFCNGGDSGVAIGQATTITLQPIVDGISLNFGGIGLVSTPTATDCKGSEVSIGHFTYSTTNMAIADVQPTTGHLCAGTWNRNSGAGIPDYTYCISNGISGTAYIAAAADGVTSNPLPVFVHSVVTSIVLGGASASCSTDPTTACAPASLNSALAPSANASCPTSAAYPSNPQLANGCCTIPPNTALSALLTPPTPYNSNACISQGQTAQLIARVYAGTGASQTNISCQIGHLVFSAASSTNTASVVSIDQNGVATAEQPGSVLVTADISNAASSAGYFSTCPPASIALSAPGATTNPVVVTENNTQPLSAIVLDTHGVTLTGLTLEYVSTQPTTIPAAATLDPTLAGAASISAICQPPTCNTSAYDQIGLFGNGKPITSNSVNVTTPGTNSTVLYMASTQSMYVASRDFTQPAAAQPFLLPYLPNSMLISNDGSTIYMGSSNALMVLNAVSTLGITRTDITSPGVVIGLSPDGSTIVISDPVRQIITLETNTGGVISTYGGVGTHAEFTPDNQTIYITAGTQLLVYSTYTGWTSITPATPSSTPVTDVAVTVPGVGAYFAGPVTTARGYCPASTLTAPPTGETNIFYPPADTSAAVTDRIAATNDGLHILGATVSPTPTFNDLHVQIPAGNPAGPSVSIACPTTGGLAFSNTVSPTPLTPITASAITGVLPTSDSSIAFVTYTGSGGVLPAYAPAAIGPGTTTYIPLSGAATAPVSGVVTSDNSTVYVGTSGDNLVHVITRSTLTDSSTLTPALTTPAGAPTPVNLIVQKPRKTT